jgi:capsular exopolysaccharide synthesis family protein
MSRIYELLQRSDKPLDLSRPSTFAVEARKMIPRVIPGGRGLASGGSDVAALAGILQRQWRVVTVCTVGAAVVALLASLLMKSIYEPEARLDIDPPGNEQFSITPQAVSGDTEYLQTQVQNLQSDALAVAVIRRLRLAPDSVEGTMPAPQEGSVQAVERLTPGESAALREFQSRLKVEHDPGSRVIGIAVGAHDPVQAAKVTNALAHLYVKRMSDARHEAIEQSVRWLSGQLKDIRQQMEDSNRALVDFQRTNGVAEVDQGRSTYGEMLADLNKQRTQTSADRIQLEALLNNVHENADALPQVHDSQLIQQLTQKLAEVRADLAQSRAIYGPNHPNVKRLENQRDELQAQLNNQKKGILNQLKTAYAAARAREGLMSREVTDTTRQLSLVAEYNSLRREAQANTDLYNTLYSKVEETAISAASRSSNVRIMDPARVLDKPTRPRRLLNLVLGLAAGLVLGLVAAFIFEGLDNSVRTPEDVHQCDAKLPVSVVPVISGNENGGLGLLKAANGNGNRVITGYEPLLLSRPQSAEAEAVRGLRTSLMLSRLHHPPRVILIASSLPGEGKTTMAVNLAVALAQQSPTCLVDCDRRNSVLSSIFEPVSELGLGDVLAGTLPLSEAVFDTDVPGLCVIPCGRAAEGAYDLANREAMKETLEGLRERFQFIIVDSPPILPYADGRVLSTIVDGVVFVGRPHLTTREAMKRSLEVLAQVNSAPILEVVLNAAESDVADYQYYRYGYKS